MSTSGSIRGVTIDGIQYRVNGDGDGTFKFSPFETEGIATSGDTTMKMIIVSPNVEGLPLSVDADEIDSLTATAAKTSDYPLSVAMADGTERKAQGRVMIGDYSNADAKVEVTLIPKNALRGWERF